MYFGVDPSVVLNQATNSPAPSAVSRPAGPPANDAAFDTKQISWADMTALNRLPKVALDVDAHADGGGDGREVTMRLHNTSTRVAFFERAELLAGSGLPEAADEILPIEYDDNYVTVFPGETVEIYGRVPAGGPVPGWVRVTGYNGTPVIVPVR